MKGNILITCLGSLYGTGIKSYILDHMNNSAGGRGSSGCGDAGGGGHGRAEALVEEPEAADDRAGLGAGLGDGSGEHIVLRSGEITNLF